MKKSEEYQKTLNQEIALRIQTMEQSGYAFPQRFHKKNYIILGSIVVCCLIIIILGAWL